MKGNERKRGRKGKKSKETDFEKEMMLSIEIGPNSTKIE